MVLWRGFDPRAHLNNLDGYKKDHLMAENENNKDSQTGQVTLKKNILKKYYMEGWEPGLTTVSYDIFCQICVTP